MGLARLDPTGGSKGDSSIQGPSHQKLKPCTECPTDVKRLQNGFKAELIKDHPEIDLSAIKVIETSEVQRTIAGKVFMKVD